MFRRIRFLVFLIFCFTPFFQEGRTNECDVSPLFEGGGQALKIVLPRQAGDIRIVLHKKPLTEVLARTYGFQNIRGLELTAPYSYADFRYQSRDGIILKDHPFTLGEYEGKNLILPRSEPITMILDGRYPRFSANGNGRNFNRGDLIVPFTVDKSWYCHLHIVPKTSRANLLSCAQRTFFKRTTRQRVDWMSPNSFDTRSETKEYLLKPYDKEHFTTIRDCLSNISVPCTPQGRKIYPERLVLWPIVYPRLGFKSLSETESKAVASVDIMAGNTNSL